MTKPELMPEQSSSKLQLALGTGAFALCFAVFGSMSAMMPIISKHMALTPVQKSVAIAIPVLLGSLGRIPLGILTDRFGGRIVFSLVMVFSIIPAFLMGGVSNYAQLLIYGFFIGIALASFSVGVAFVNGWYPPERQGFALGIYGAGNIGQSLAAYGSPVLAAAIGFKWGFWTFGVLLSIWLVIFATMARNAPGRGPAKSLAEIVRPLNDKRSWVLSLYYFLTFGGFVAMAVYLPTLLTEVFKLTPQDAGFRTAGFVVLATGDASDRRRARGQSWRTRDPEVGLPCHRGVCHLPGLPSDVNLHHWRAGHGGRRSDSATVLSSNWFRSTSPSRWAALRVWSARRAGWADSFRPWCSASSSSRREPSPTDSFC